MPINALISIGISNSFIKIVTWDEIVYKRDSGEIVPQNPLGRWNSFYKYGPHNYRYHRQGFEIVFINIAADLKGFQIVFIDSGAQL